MSSNRALLAAACLLAACATDHKLYLKNNTGVPLTYCPVVTQPPPPHRTVSSQVVAATGHFEIDIDGFNPVFWDPVSKLGVQVQMALADDPALILAVVLQYKVPPGAEGTDPALQPVALHEYPYEVDTEDDRYTIVVRAGAISDQGLPVTFVEN